MYEAYLCFITSLAPPSLQYAFNQEWQLRRSTMMWLWITHEHLLVNTLALTSSGYLVKMSLQLPDFPSCFVRAWNNLAILSWTGVVIAMLSYPFRSKLLGKCVLKPSALCEVIKGHLYLYQPGVQPPLLESLVKDKDMKTSINEGARH